MLRLVAELFWLLFTTMHAAARSHQDLVLENLLLRHQLAVLTRPTRRRPHAGLRLWDKLVWILARRFCAGWREHLSFVTPERPWCIRPSTRRPGSSRVHRNRGHARR